jgi:hypothetical protein
MLEQIAALVKKFGQDTVVNNPDISNDVNNDVLTEATKTISGGMQNMLAGGGLQDIISMFTGGGGQSGTQKSGIGGILKNPMVMMMVGHFVSKLISKFKMSPEKANNVSSALIPNVLNDLVTRTKDNSPENDAFDLNDLIGSLTGGKVATAENGGGFNFQNLIKQFTGGGNDSNSGNGGGGFNIQDIISQVTSGAQENQAKKNSGGGLFDLIKGFISK